MKKHSNIFWSASTLLFTILTGITIVKCHLFATMTIAWLKNWHDFSIEGQLMAIVAVSLVMGSLIWIFRRPWITISCVIICDLWILSNWIYYQANHLLLTFSAVTIGSNMNGFWSSILAYLSPQMIWIPLLTGVYATLAIRFRPTQRHLMLWGSTILVAGILSISSSFIRCQHVGAANSLVKNPPITIANFNPFITPSNMLPDIWETDLKDINYTLHHSILTYGIQVFTKGICEYYHTIHVQTQVTLDPQEEQQINLLLSRGCSKQDSMLSCDGNLFIIIIESWESWSLESKDVQGKYILAKINKFMNNHPHLYADKVNPQIRFGNSADGQLIINTGLLPIQDGATCFLYPSNTYPNLAHFYSHSVNLDACSKVWNSTYTSMAYQYKEHIAPDDKNWWVESITCAKAKDYLALSHNSTCLQLITIAMHPPFNHVKDEPVYQELQVPANINSQTENYLRSAHWMDFFIGDLLQYMEDEGFLANSTIVLTGDHTFNRDNQHFCPLVVFSPSITQNHYITDQCYQMDIYPTILSLIGRKDYFWQGFGIDLTDSNAQRLISPQCASTLSDKLLRMNYFHELHTHTTKSQKPTTN